ncbi:MAG: heparinase II/III-family protein [Oscillospiraceae bacterium]|nr:heparinase II/III-family protein [Oscillospiraceae bacterium]
MIYELLKEKNLAEILSENATNRLLPEYGDRKSWDSLPVGVKQFFTNKAGKLKDKQYMILPATVYMEYTRTGDRAIYENIYFERREDLITLTIAECINAKSEYIDQIINLVWAICEETSWVPSMHNNKGELPDIEYEIYVDLFSAETGAIMAWVYYFFGDIIAQNAPTVKRRVEIEVDKRILTPYLQYNHFWYMGLETKDTVNNWNPWINSNVIIAFAIFEKSEKNIKRLIQGIEKTAKITDVFINSYHADGACDEGPGYFGAAGAALFDYLEILSDITSGKINIYDNGLIKNMAGYIYKVYIGKDSFVNFADGPSRSGAPAKLLARVGDAVGDENLTGFANELIAKSGDNKNYSVGFHTYRYIKSLFQKENHDKKFIPPKVCWFDGTQILTARDNEGSIDGIFIAAKGGHNDESHNHNDAGHFILYCDGNPVIIDAGVETYTKKTFSDDRYDIWTMQSGYHNLPKINGFDETNMPNGRYRRATDVIYKHENNNTTGLSMQLKDAYPETARIDSYIREFVFKHGISFTVRDKYILKELATEPFVFNLMCANKPVINENNVQLGENIKMTFDSAVFFASIDEIELTDQRLLKDWQRKYLYRIRLTEKELKKENDMIICFEKRK